MKTNNDMEFLRKLREQQPEVYDQLPVQKKMALGYYLETKKEPEEITKEELNQIKELKSRADAADITPFERMTVGLQITELERKIK